MILRGGKKTWKSMTDVQFYEKYQLMEWKNMGLRMKEWNRGSKMEGKPRKEMTPHQERAAILAAFLSWAQHAFPAYYPRFTDEQCAPTARKTTHTSCSTDDYLKLNIIRFLNKTHKTQMQTQPVTHTHLLTHGRVGPLLSDVKKQQ